MTPSVMSDAEALKNSCLVAESSISSNGNRTSYSNPIELCANASETFYSYVDHKTFAHSNNHCLMHILTFEGIHLIFSCFWVFTSEKTG